MGTIQLGTGDDARAVPLAASTIVGRHSGSTWVLDTPSTPGVWLELRWGPGGWAWRALAQEDRTLGPTTRDPLTPPGWFRIRQGGRVRGPDSSLTLLDASAPAPFVVDLSTGEALDDDTIDAVLLRDHEGRCWPADVDGGADVQPLSDHDVFVAGSRALRVHLPEELARTQGPGLDVLAPDLRLALDGDDRLTVSAAGGEVVVTGGLARVVAPYIEARIRDLPRGGWLDLDAAFEGWVERGGDSHSPRLRVTQDRSRLRRKLAGLGLANPDRLFETRQDGRWLTRLALTPDQIDWVEDAP